MRIVQGDEIPEKPVKQHRAGKSYRKRLLDGEVGDPGNFSLVLARPEERFSPRHRHNFEQFRYQLEGVADYSTTGKLRAGMLAYFPECVHYGPQTEGEGTKPLALVLQFGGPSGGGYAGREATSKAAEELRQVGSFKDGVFYPNPGATTIRQKDSFEAVWEHINGRPLEYPGGRYEAPILMNPDNYDWVPVDDQQGVHEKPLGVFHERRTGASFYRIDPGAEWNATGRRELFFVLKGEGTIEGEPLRRETVIYLDPGESARFTATSQVEMINFRLPDLSHLKSASHPEQQAKVA